MNKQQKEAALAAALDTIRRLSRQDDVAQLFRDAGARGGHHPWDCPAAVWLSAQCHSRAGAGTGVSVSNGCVWLKHRATAGGHLPMPAVLKRFVRAYDRDRYPDLEASP